MDAKERHELKDNDLAEFLQNFGEFWDKHGNFISVVILVGVLGWFGWKYYGNMQLTAHENAWSDLSATATPTGYRERARETEGDKALPQLALLRGAEAFHQQAVQVDQDATAEDAGMMSAEESLDNAEAMYKQVLDSNADVVFRANAAAGLANVAETRGDYTAAEEHWTKAKSLAEEAHLSAIAAQAKVRLTLLADLSRPIIFADPDEVAPIEDDASTETAPANDEPAVEAPAAEDSAAATEAPAVPGP